MVNRSQLQYSLNSEFIKNLHTYFGARADIFLDNLPELISKFENEWNIEVETPFPNLSFNFVAPAKGLNNEAYVFKCGVPNREFTTEIDTLAFIDGIGLPKLIQASKEDAAMLQERVLPGVSLRKVMKEGRLSDDKATEVAAIAMRDFFESAKKPLVGDYSFPHITDWLKALDQLKPNNDNRRLVFPSELLDRCEVLLPELISSMGKSILLHGDLHHDNIISNNESWMVIDPKGILGEACYEVGAFLRNPQELIYQSDMKSIIHKRIDIFAEVLDLEPERIAAWHIVQAVLSVWWSIEGNSNVSKLSDLDAWERVPIDSALAVCDLI